MTRTRTADTRIVATLRKRIRQFYEHLNREQFEKCYATIDPTLREAPTSVTLYQYVTSLERFRKWCGRVDICQIAPIQLHLNEPNRLYHNRDFALLDVVWEDQSGQRRSFTERWVRDGRGRWYTRSTGFVSPGARDG
jgi:hypothetical protein